MARSSALLGKELDVLVDGENEIAARLGVVLAGAENFAARVHGGVHFAGHAVELLIELVFEAAEAVVVDADIAKYLRGDLVVWIEALELFLVVDALHIEGVDASGDIVG